MANTHYGRVERGKITKVTDKGCSVASLDRKGIETLPISANGITYKVGDRVYFASFPDGTGLILGYMTETKAR